MTDAHPAKQVPLLGPGVRRFRAFLLLYFFSMTLSSVQAIRYLKAALLLASAALITFGLSFLLKIAHPRLEASPRELELDLQELAHSREQYKTAVEAVLEQGNPDLCQSLPDLILPYRRDPDGTVRYVKSQSDGPIVPERLSYWPRKQCLFAYASHTPQETDRCAKLFPIPEEQKDCLSASIQTLTRFETLEDLPDEVQPLLGKKRFYSTSGRRSLPYYILYPEKQVQGILIYLHGAGGGLEQGQLDGTYKDSFKKLKHLLKNDLRYLYVTPALSTFGANGGQDAIDLARELQTRYPTIPLFLAGASAGGRTTFYALKHSSGLFKGAIALCPAVDSTITHHDWSQEPSTPLWIAQGTHDQFIPINIIDDFVTRLTQQSQNVTYIRIPDGDHGAPIDQIDWKAALSSF